jgi:ADP-ribose pyrophosphatase YjhB (NUDIX family)
MKYLYPFPNVSVTATIFAFYNEMLVVGIRSHNAEVYPSHKCIPGGFLNARYADGETVVHEGENVQQAAIREFQEEAGVELESDQLILFHEHSNPITDPRCHVVNLCYIVNLSLEQVEKLMAGDDLEAIDLVPISDIKEGTKDQYWAFNHFDLALLAIHVWENGGDYFKSKGNWS